jgi:soluble lytic murein transglycosylase-like protein
MLSKKRIKTHTARLTPASDTKSSEAKIDDAARLRQIRALVDANNQSSMDTDVVICQIYMESRFDPTAHAQGSSARGLMQLLKAPIRELYRLENLQKPKKERNRLSTMSSAMLKAIRSSMACAAIRRCWK